MRKPILTAAVIIIASVSVFSQSVTETRRIKTTALQIYENYKVVMSDLYSKSDYTEDNFMALFESKALIYNDIIPANTPSLLSPARYYENFKENIKRIYPVFSDFRMDEPVSVENKWQIKCRFTRATKFKTQKDMNYPEWSFNYSITIEMDRRYDDNKKVYENAKITNIQVDNPLKGFFVIENKENLPLVTKSGEAINDWDNEYNSRIFPEDKWKISDIHVSQSSNYYNFFEYSKNKFSPNRKDAHFYQFDNKKIRKNIFGIGVNYSPIALGNNMSETNTENFKENSALSFSLFYGTQIAHKEKSTLFFDVGLDLNRYSYKYSANGTVPNNENIQRTDSDKDFYPYKPEICINKPVAEKINITSVSVPLSVQYLYQLSQNSKKPIFLSFELGVFAECTLPSTKKDKPNVNYHGIYDIRFHDGSEERPFSHYYDYGDSITVDRSLKLASRFDFGILGDVGLWVTLDKSNLLKFDVSYKFGFNSSLNYTENYNFSQNNNLSFPQNAKQALRSIGFGISWVKTIGKNE